MNRLCWLLCSCALLLLVDVPARGGSASIEFDLSNTEVGLIGGVIQIPPDGSIDPASKLTVTFSADVASDLSAGTIVAGPAKLHGLAVKGTFSKDFVGQAVVSGSVDCTQMGSAGASLSGSLGEVLVGDISADIEAMADCAGAICAQLGTFPVVVSGVETFPGGTLMLTGANTPGAAEISGTFIVSVGDESATVSLLGVESARSYSVPEPGGPWLVAVAALSLGIRTASVRRSRSRRHSRPAGGAAEVSVG